MSPDDAVIDLVRRLPAPPRQVFAAFSEAAILARWLSPSPAVGLTLLAFDFRVDGAYRFAYHLEDGTTVTVGGRYLAIDPPTAIVFSWVWEPPDVHAGIESTVSVTIVPDGTGALLSLRHERLARPDALRRHRDGWTGALERLMALFASDGNDTA